jgi:uncharacterized HAD superfamily protein
MLYKVRFKISGVSMKKIFVDIDGVLTHETEGWNYSERTPRTDMIQYINDLAETNHITLFTARFECDREDTIEWLKQNGVVYHDLIMDKPQYDILIDDRATWPSFILKRKVGLPNV